MEWDDDCHCCLHCALVKNGFSLSWSVYLIEEHECTCHWSVVKLVQNQHIVLFLVHRIRSSSGCFRANIQHYNIPDPCDDMSHLSEIYLLLSSLLLQIHCLVWSCHSI